MASINIIYTLFIYIRSILHNIVDHVYFVTSPRYFDYVIECNNANKK